jgi:DNA sulfur modification protein DndD
MRLLSLTLNDIGLFRGRHYFDLAPSRAADGSAYNLVVIKGANGVGKSTLFQSIALALHGRLALGDRVSEKDYNDYLRQRLHRSGRGEYAGPSNEGSIALSLQYVLSGKPLRVDIERQFNREGLRVGETLIVRCDGQPPEVDAADYQAWLNDLVPPGLLSLCLFDAERLDAFSNPEQHDNRLAESLRRLLGLDIVERLQTDLDHYLFSKGGGRKGLDKLRAQVVDCQTTVDGLKAQLKELHERAQEIAAEKADLAAALAEQEQKLIAEGGLYASRRPMLQERLKVISEEIEALENELREMCGELLPFALAPELGRCLSERLKRESKARTEQAADALWQERVTELKDKLDSEKFWDGVKVSAKDRKAIAGKVTRAMRKSRAAQNEPLLHNLSDAESEKLQGWIAQATEVVPRQVKAIGERLRTLQEEKRKIEIDLKRAPDDATLAPIHAEIARLQTSLAGVEHRQSELGAQVGAFQFQFCEAERQLQRAYGEFEKARRGERQLGLAERSRAALRTYRDALVRERIAALEQALIECFNRICRKEHLLGAVHINADDFRVDMQGDGGRALSLSDFSAGERQLYALALLWALRKVSGYQLPLAIDTPLARLDETHRHRIINEYIPAVSDQVLLFATDAELNDELMAETRLNLAREYRLKCVANDEFTEEKCFSGVPDGVVLYHGGEHGLNGYDYSDDVGQVWMTDFDHAASYGAVRKAILPSTAKRLVIIEPGADEYNWDSVTELAQLIGNPYLPAQLRGSGAIYDFWKSEWTQTLIQYGYDSVATHNIEGPIEYVLNPSKLIVLDNPPIAVAEEAFVFDA